MIIVEGSYIQRKMPRKKLATFSSHYLVIAVILTAAVFYPENTRIRASEKKALPPIRTKGASIEQDKALEQAFPAFLASIPETLPLKFMVLEVSIESRGRSVITAVFSFDSGNRALPEYSALEKIFSGIAATAEKAFMLNETPNPIRFNYGIAMTKSELHGKESCLFFARETPRGIALMPYCFLRLENGRFLQIPVILKDNRIIPNPGKAETGETAIFNTFFSSGFSATTTSGIKQTE